MCRVRSTCIHVYSKHHLYTCVELVPLVYICRVSTTCIHVYSEHHLYTCVQWAPLVLYMCTVSTTCCVQWAPLVVDMCTVSSTSLHSSQVLFEQGILHDSVSTFPHVTVCMQVQTSLYNYVRGVPHKGPMTRFLCPQTIIVYMQQMCYMVCTTSRHVPYRDLHRSTQLRLYHGMALQVNQVLSVYTYTCVLICQSNHLSLSR